MMVRKYFLGLPIRVEGEMGTKAGGGLKCLCFKGQNNQSVFELFINFN
jgi:hypothetical protein